MKKSPSKINVKQLQRSTPQLIANAIRESIVQGSIGAGEQLFQDDIATKFGVSRIPVREALRQLEVEGLITYYPNRGAIVTELSALEVQEIYEIRVALETLALRLAMDNLSGEDLKRAEDVLDRIEAEHEASRWVDLNWQFHDALYGAAKRPRLVSMIKTLYVQVDRYVHLQLKGLNYMDRSQREHRELLSACQQKNVERSVLLLEQHIQAAADSLVKHLQS